nr:glycosyltransferase [Acinetobacter sp. Marseille-Q1620]
MNIDSRLDAYTCLNSEKKFIKTFSFCTLVTRPDEYLEMVESAKAAGFSEQLAEFFYFDNKNSNTFDAYKGINKALRHVNGEYLIFCHQDILFHHDKCEKLQKILADLDENQADWAIAGNAGKDENGRTHIVISEPDQPNIRQGKIPNEVMSLDENFLIINRKHNIACTTIFHGFHLYGLDLCENARRLGLKAYVIDFLLLHKSSGKVDNSYRVLQKQYISWWSQNCKSRFLWAMCSNFFISSNPFLRYMGNQKKILNLIKSLRKKVYK